MNDLSLAMIIPVLNEEVCISQSVKRLQILQNEAFIQFCDGGSSDQTVLLLKKHAMHVCQSPSGRALQMNTAAKLCESDILLFIHADSILSSSNIALIKTVMQDKSLVGGRFDVRLSGKDFAFRVIEFMINLRSRITGISTGDQCQFVRRSVFESMGGFPEQALMEDVEFSKRLKAYGKIACLKNKVTTSSRRWEKYGIAKTVWLMWKMRFLYWWGIPSEKLADMYHHVR